MSTNQNAQMDDLYQEIILDHFKNPRNFEVIAEADALVNEENPTCGDQICLNATVENGKITDIKYEARGCAISTASASMMSEALLGQTVDEARERVLSFARIMKGEAEMPEDADDLAALEGVKRYPLRIKCATMAWHALHHALDKLTASS